MMSEWYGRIVSSSIDNHLVLSQLPDMFNPSDDSFGVLIGLFMLALVVVGVAFYATHLFKTREKFKEFETEMKALELTDGSEGTLIDMVKRHSLEEPIQVLFSIQLFDEMATKEIDRILGSAASAEFKENFIDAVYEIRTKTYHSDWLEESHSSLTLREPGSSPTQEADHTMPKI